jgi:c-di-GMP-binding flagellar brake protein YcgR
MAKKTKKKQLTGRVENRVVERNHLVFYLRVFDDTNNSMLGHLADISTDGFMLVSVVPIEPEQNYRLRMLLPKEIEGRLELVFEARSRWCRPDSNPDFHLSGFRYLKVDKELVSQIMRLVYDFGREADQQTKDAKPPACNLTHTTGK